MIDPRTTAVLVRSRDGVVKNRTLDVASMARRGDTVSLTFRGHRGGAERSYTYAADKVTVLTRPQHHPVPTGTTVFVDGRASTTARAIYTFAHRTEPTCHVDHGSSVTVHDASAIRLHEPTAADRHATEAMTYWAQVVGTLQRASKAGSLGYPYSQLSRDLEPDCALVHLFESPWAAIESPTTPVVHPWKSNLSQRSAVEKALSARVSIIDGPPGTGKTQAILNLVASCLLAGRTIGVVSLSNAAVANVADKLEEAGIGFVAARLGKADNRAAFHSNQQRRNAQVDSFVRQSPSPAADEDAATRRTRLERLTRDIKERQETERKLAAVRKELADFRVQREHFRRLDLAQALPEIDDLAITHKRLDTVLDFIAEHTVEAETGQTPGLIARLRRRLRYGSTRAHDPQDGELLMALEGHFYDKNIDRLEQDEKRLAGRLSDLPGLLVEHTRLSRQLLDEHLAARYRATARTIHPEKTSQWKASFLQDYPVVLSTCHSLRSSLPPKVLLDVLVVDEASQADLLSSALALRCARSVVVVGDQQQLSHIAEQADDLPKAPHPTLDYATKSLLDMAGALAPSPVSRTRLLEHYRCHPSIIEYCNQSFYDGELITMSEHSAAAALHIVRTAPGTHMRYIAHEGGLLNQREADVIRHEVLDSLQGEDGEVVRLLGDGTKVAVVTPYRAQVGTVRAAVGERAVADTVHAFQGRQCATVIVSTVIDTKAWSSSLAFVDDPRLVNVAVSRAQDMLVIVCEDQELARTRHLRTLVEYIRYQTLDTGRHESQLVSVFDLFYKRYAPHLDRFRMRAVGPSRYLSEQSGRTVLTDVLAEEEFRGLDLVDEPYLRNLFPDVSAFTPDEVTYVRNGARFDFVVYQGLSKRAVLAVEVDGVAYHRARPEQLAKDALKNSMCTKAGLSLLRLPTDGHSEHDRVRHALRAALGAAPSTVLVTS